MAEGGSSSLQAPKAASTFLMGFFWQAPCSQSLTGVTVDSRDSSTRTRMASCLSLPTKLSFLSKLEAELKAFS